MRKGGRNGNSPDTNKKNQEKTNVKTGTEKQNIKKTDKNKSLKIDFSEGLNFNDEIGGKSEYEINKAKIEANEAEIARLQERLNAQPSSGKIEKNKDIQKAEKERKKIEEREKKAAARAAKEQAKREAKEAKERERLEAKKAKEAERKAAEEKKAEEALRKENERLEAKKAKEAERKAAEEKKAEEALRKENERLEAKKAKEAERKAAEEKKAEEALRKEKLEQERRVREEEKLNEKKKAAKKLLESSDYEPLKKAENTVLDSVKADAAAVAVEVVAAETTKKIKENKKTKTKQENKDKKKKERLEKKRAAKEQNEKIAAEAENLPASEKAIAGSYEFVSVLICASIIIAVLFTFFFRFSSVVGVSMKPGLHSGDWVVLSQMGDPEPKYGDIVVISQPNSFNENIIKRVIATEGEVVDIDFGTGDVKVDGKVLDEPYINNPTINRYDMQFPLIVPKGYCFVMGDNRQNSIDSRSTAIGLIRDDYILGRACAASTQDGFHTIPEIERRVKN